METLEKLLERKYPVEVSWVEEEDGEGYWFAFHPDFGHSACSAVGDTPEEAIADLALVRQDIIEYYLEQGKPIPAPSLAPVVEDPLKQMPLRLPKSLHEKIKRVADFHGQSLNAYAISCLTEQATLETKVNDAVEKAVTKAVTPLLELLKKLNLERPNTATESHTRFVIVRENEDIVNLLPAYEFCEEQTDKPSWGGH